MAACASHEQHIGCFTSRPSRAVMAHYRAMCNVNYDFRLATIEVSGQFSWRKR